MPERDGYIPGVPCWIDTSQPDPEAALAFYTGLFGWEFENMMPEGSEGTYFIGRIRNGDVAAVGPIPEGAPPTAMWNTYVWVDSADATATMAREANIKSVGEKGFEFFEEKSRQLVEENTELKMKQNAVPSSQDVKPG